MVPVTAEKLSEAGVNETTGAGSATPVPLSATVCGEPVALSVTETAAAKLAPEIGVKVTEMVQLEPTTSEAPQVFVWLKSEEFAPVIAIAEIESAAVPGFESVTV